MICLSMDNVVCNSTLRSARFCAFPLSPGASLDGHASATGLRSGAPAGPEIGTTPGIRGKLRQQMKTFCYIRFQVDEMLKLAHESHEPTYDTRRQDATQYVTITATAKPTRIYVAEA
jgi:hypothetical protein